MSRCIQLGKNGLGQTAPNPMVGCVIVGNGKIIGEGFTSAYGGPHAEVNAINSVVDAMLLHSATLYVTLEPCAHFGKTPPCSDLIIAHKIPNIVIGTQDPNEDVAGRGIAKLKAAGCKVGVGILERECRTHHKRFLTFHEKKRPYIMLKWAESVDGFIAPVPSQRSEKPSPYWITNSKSRQLVHKWRSEEQAILVGSTTILNDNPKLDVRHWSGKNPIRMVLDRHLKIGSDYHTMDGNIPTLVFTEIEEKAQYLPGIQYVVVNFTKELPSQICDILHHWQLVSLLIEGGARTLQSFIDANLWDEIRVFTGKTSFGKGLKAPVFSGSMQRRKQIASDTLTLYTND